MACAGDQLHLAVEYTAFNVSSESQLTIGEMANRYTQQLLALIMLHFSADQR